MSSALPVIINKPVNSREKIEKYYGLTQQVFDPFSSSPPNSFIVNLKMRLAVYDLFMNDAIRKSE